MKKLLLISALLLFPNFAWANAVVIGLVAGLSTCQTLETLLCDSNGWTQFAVGPGGFVEGNTACGSAAANATCIFYVNTSGSDSNDCTFASPCLTPEHAMGLTRNGSPDWVLMAKGQTWTDHSPIQPVRSKGGLDINNPQLVSSYDPSAGHSPPVPNPYTGGARPLVIVTGTWYVTDGNTYVVGSAGGAGGSAGNYLAYSGIRFYACTRDPNASLCAFSSTDSQALESGMTFSFSLNGLLIEDCSFEFFAQNSITNANTYTPQQNVFVRRSEFLSTYPSTSNPSTSQGLLINPLIGGPSGSVIYETIFDHGSWICATLPCTINGHTFTTWGAQSGFNHNLYQSDEGIHGDVTTFGTPWNTSNNIFSNDGASTQLRLPGLYKGNLFINNPFNHGMGTLNGTIFATQITGNVAVNGLSTAVADPQMFQLVPTVFDGLPPATTYTVNYSNNLMVNTPASPNTAVGIQLNDGSTGVTVNGNVIYNWGINNTSQSLIFSNGGVLTFSVTAQGSGYTDNSLAITSAESSTTFGSDTQGYLVVAVGSTTSVHTNGSVMYKVGSNAIQGPVPAFVLDATHIVIYGVQFSAALPAANGGATFTGTLYFPYYQVSMTGGTGSGAQLDLFSVGGVIVAATNGGSDSNTTHADAPGTGYVVNDVLTSTVSGGSGAHVTLNTVSTVNVSATGCNLATQNIVDPSGSNPSSCTYSDPNRTAGSYYATLAGSTANATFTGVVDANGVLTVSGITGTESVGDAITWAGQTKADYLKADSTHSNTLCAVSGGNCTGAGGNGTYFMAGAKSVGSQSMSSYTAQQLINLMRVQSKATWNTALTACAVNKYIKAGFGITDTCNVNQ